MLDDSGKSSSVTAGSLVGSGKSGCYGWWLVFLAVGILYVLTLAPDVVWQDQGDYQLQAARCSLSRPGDVVRVHPLFIVTAHALGRLPFFGYAYAANLTSAIFTAVSAANVFLLVYWIVGRVFPGVLSAGAYAMAHSVWFLGVQAQTYGMANAFMTAGLLMAFRYLYGGHRCNIVVMGLMFGLGLSAHLTSQVAFAVIIVWLIWRALSRQLSLSVLSLVFIAWFIGAALNWYVMFIEYQRTGDLPATIASSIWGQWSKAVFNFERIPVLVKKSVLFFVLNFPTPLVLLAPVGISKSFKRISHRQVSVILIMLTVLYALFAARYDVPNQNNFFLPMYLFIAIYIGLGFDYLFSGRRNVYRTIAILLLIAIGPAYLFISNYARRHAVDLGTKRKIPFRDVYKYYIRPWQQFQTGPRQLVTETFRVLPENAVLFADSTTIPAFLYVHEVENRRKDIDILPLGPGKEKPQEFGDRPIFTLSIVKGYYPEWADGDKLLEIPLTENNFIYRIP